jgi:hypothetical protein
VQPIEPQPNQQRNFFLLQTFNGNRDFGCEKDKKLKSTGKLRKKLIQLKS